MRKAEAAAKGILVHADHLPRFAAANETGLRNLQDTHNKVSDDDGLQRLRCLHALRYRCWIRLHVHSIAVANHLLPLQSQLIRDKTELVSEECVLPT